MVLYGWLVRRRNACVMRWDAIDCDSMWTVAIPGSLLVLGLVEAMIVINNDR